MLDPSLHLTLLPNLASALVLTCTFFYVWRVSGERYLLIWALASLLWTARYAYGIVTPVVLPDSPAWDIPLSSIVRSGLFIWGGAMMVERSVPKLYWGAAALSILWLFGAPPRVPPEWAAMPVYALFAGSLLTVAWWLGRAHRFPPLERALAAWPMAAYALLQLSFPWSRTLLRGVAPAAYLLASVLQIALALGVLMIYLRTAELELKAHHDRLSATLMRALSGYMNICPACHAIENEGGSWERLESYVMRRAGTAFSHGICPPCLDQHYAFDDPE